MTWIEVTDSRTIAAVPYDAATEVLEVRFRREHVYRYEGAAQFVYLSLLRAESKGRYFNDFIRDGYDYDEAADPLVE